MNGYGGQHQATRRALAPYAAGMPCCRCGRPILPGQAFDLDHDDDRRTYRGLAHSRCNRQAGGRLGVARKKARKARREGIRRMVTAVVLGIELATDRSRTSVAAAGWLDGDLVFLELAAYVPGVDAVPTVLRLRTERDVLGVIVDPKSPAATTIKPLRAAGVQVTEPNASDVVVAHGGFLDLVNSGRLRHTGQPELTAAVRHATQRPMGAATALERRSPTVDVSPAVAGELACWGLENLPTPQPFFASWR